MISATYPEIRPDQISHLSLREAIADQMVTAYRVTIWNYAGNPEPEVGELAIFDNDRFGHAFGGNAVYGDVESDGLCVDGGSLTLPLPF